MSKFRELVFPNVSASLCTPTDSCHHHLRQLSTLFHKLTDKTTIFCISTNIIVPLIVWVISNIFFWNSNTLILSFLLTFTLQGSTIKHTFHITIIVLLHTSKLLWTHKRESFSIFIFISLLYPIHLLLFLRIFPPFLSPIKLLFFHNINRQSIPTNQFYTKYVKSSWWLSTQRKTR